jgi:hypothetical protein
MTLFHPKRADLVSVIFVSLVLSACFAKMHVDVIDRQYLFDEIVLHGQIVRHNAPAPYQYRVLQPLVVDSIVKDIPKHWYRKAFVFCYSWIRFASLSAMMVCLFLALRSRFPHWKAFGGMLLLSAFIPFTFHNYYFQPSSIFEYAVFAIALLATVKQRIAWLYPLVLFGTLNRETTVFVPVIYVLWHFPTLRKMDYFRLLPVFGVWAIVFVGLRLLIPAPVDLLDIKGYVSMNLTSYYDDLDVLLILLVCFLPFVRWPHLPGEYRRLLFFNVLWIPLHFLAAQWWEIRYFIPSIMISLPAILCSLEASTSKPDHLSSGVVDTVFEKG